MAWTHSDAKLRRPLPQHVSPFDRRRGDRPARILPRNTLPARVREATIRPVSGPFEGGSNVRTILTTLLALLLLGGVAQAQTFDLQTFNTRLSELEDDDAIVALCRDFLSHSDDIDAVRTAQDSWKGIDPESALEYARQKAADNPTSPRYVYLLGRLVEGKLEAIELGRKAIHLDPTWPYGYRLVLAQYSSGLFRSDDSTRESRQLEAAWAEDEPLLQQLLTLVPEEAYPIEFVMYARFYAHDYAGALGAIEMGTALGAPWADGLARARAYAGMGRFDTAVTVVEEEVDRRIREWHWSPEFRGEMIKSYYTDALRRVKAYDRAVDFLLKDTSSVDGGDYYDAACLLALGGKREPAFRYLSRAGEHGWDKVRHTGEDADLAALRDDPRWNALMNVFAANWENGREARREKALGKRVDTEAPAWSLPDADGNLVNLVDMRGKIVVLDFWSTWCGPCTVSMPMIDEFVRKHAGPDVVVFSVDVWEKGRSRPLTYMQNHAYAMKLVYGNDELAKAYGVDGIPHLCVIDRNGRIRFAESGVSDELLENLIFWTEDLAGGS